MVTPVSARRLFLALAALAAGPALARAESLNEVSQDAAKVIAAECKALNETKVAFGTLDMPQGVSSGAVIEQKIRDELKANHQIDTVTVGAKVIVRGEVSQDELGPALAVGIQLKIVDPKRNVLRQPNAYKVTTHEDVAIILGLTYTPPKDPRKAAGELTEAGKKPTTNIVGKRVSTPDGLYGFEVLVDGKARDVKSESLGAGAGALAFVDLSPGEVYTIKLYNDSDRRVSAAIHIDGLSVYHFAKTEKKPDGRIVEAKGTSEYRGWFLDKETSAKFLVGRLEDDKLKDLKIDKVGTITVAFANFYGKDEKFPPDDDPTKATSGPVSTVPGDPFGDPRKLIEGVRGKLRGTVSLRYQQPQK